MSDDDKARREQIASNINGFLRSVNAPDVIHWSDVTITPDGVRVTTSLADVKITADIGHTALMHLTMVSGILDIGRNIVDKTKGSK